MDENQSRLRISLPRYDGPFDLLLSMIRRNEWSIDDLPIVEITGQFLAYIKAAKEIDADLGGEFVEVASWLVLLKSRSLLPLIDAGDTSPREELRRAVLDHATLAAATEFLREKGVNPRLGAGGAPAGRQDEVLVQSSEAPTIEDVVEATRKALGAARAAASLQSVDEHNTTVEYHVRWILDSLSAIPMFKPVSTLEWFAAQPSVAARAALFLALLELTKRGIVLVHQGEPFSRIRVKTTGRALANNADQEHPSDGIVSS